MTAEETELTFIRCPSCRSLVPAVATRCRMCGHHFAADDDDAGEPGADAPRKSRVRQRTISVTKEEIEDQKERIEQEREPAASSMQETPEEAPSQPKWQTAQKAPAGFQVQEDEDNEPLHFASTKTEEKPAFFPKPSWTAETGSFDEGGEDEPSSDLEAPKETNPVAVVSPNSPEADEEENEQSSAADFDSEEEFSAEEDEEEQTESEPVANPLGRQEVKRRKRRRRKRRSGGAVEQPLTVAPEGEEVQERIPQPVIKPFTPIAVEPAPSDVAFQQPQSVRTAPFQAVTERPVAQAEPEKREPVFSQLRCEENVVVSAPSVVVAVSESFTPAQSEVRPSASIKGALKEPAQSVDEGSLIGWFVSFGRDSKGLGAELRSGRFFLGGQRLRKSDMVLEDNAVSTPHCLIAASPGEVQIQDLMSEKGTYLKKKGSDTFVRVFDIVSVGHGDWLRFGEEYEVMVCLVPSE